MNHKLPLLVTSFLLLLIALLVIASPATGVDANAASEWPQWGGSPGRNNVSEAKGLPAKWSVGDFDSKTGQWLNKGAKNIQWAARLGSESYATPVIAGGKVFCSTNNGTGYLARYPKTVDLGCLLAFRQADGGFLWQYSAEKLQGQSIDWPEQGICDSPLVEGNRLWIVTNRGEVVCLDTEGSQTGKNEAEVVWRYDMIGGLGVQPHNMTCSSVTAAGNLLLLGTSNGVGEDDETIPSPQAPSFLALDKQTGKLIWADSSPGQNLLDGQWASPAFAVLGGVPQAIFPGGDGWLYSFQVEPAADGGEKTGTGSEQVRSSAAKTASSEVPVPVSSATRPKLLWKFDCNPKKTVWEPGGQGDRNIIIATPVICDGRVYIATGRDPESGEGPADLWCIDPTKRGDVSAELVVDRQGKPVRTGGASGAMGTGSGPARSSAAKTASSEASVPVSSRRFQAVDEKAGERVVPNPNSAAVWHYQGFDADKNGEMDFKESMHRALGMVAVKDGILVIGDYAGLVHCLDAATGRPYWTHDMMATIWGSPLIADGKIYLGDEDGDVAVFELAKTCKLLAENNMGDAVYGAPVAVGSTLYVSTRTHLFAIEGK